MSLVRLLIWAISASACCITIATAQDVIGRRPADRNAERPGPDVTHRAAKSVEDNAAAQQVIKAKFQEAQEALKVYDRRRAQEAAAGVAVPLGANDVERRKLVATRDYWLQKDAEFTNESVCGPGGLSRDVELYDGSLGPTRDVVDQWQPATGLIRWIPNLEAALAGLGGDTSNIDPGNVQGVGWCTGTLLPDNLFLTAGHCFDPDPKSFVTPARRIGTKMVSLAYDELAKLMLVEFNFQRDGTSCGDPNEPRSCLRRRPDTYPIVRAVEYKRRNIAGITLDYAIVELGANSAGQRPSSRYTPRSLDVEEKTLAATQMLTIIQHPNGDPKRIAAGRHLRADAVNIYYSDVDTMEGSSGAGVLDQTGRIIGVHTRGGCDKPQFNFENSGVTLNAVSQVSDLIR